MAAAERSPIVVFGTGALACAIGGRLARAGERVTLVGTWRAAREAIERRGLVVHEPGGTWSARVETTPLEAPPMGAELVLVLVKSHRTAAVAPATARALAAHGVAVTLQNGLGNRETLEAALGRGRVAVGVALLGARLLGPGEVRVVPGPILLGEEPGTAEAIRRLAGRMRAAGLAVDTSPDVEGRLWAKLAANCAINPLTALHGVPNGALLQDPDLHRTLLAAAREVGAVANAKGIDLAEEPGAIAERVAETTAGNHSSMLQDVERGAPSEVDALSGAIVAEGRRLGVPTPVNERLWRRVRDREARPVADAEAGGAGLTAAASASGSCEVRPAAAAEAE